MRLIFKGFSPLMGQLMGCFLPKQLELVKNSKKFNFAITLFRIFMVGFHFACITRMIGII